MNEANIVQEVFSQLWTLEDYKIIFEAMMPCAIVETPLGGKSVGPKRLWEASNAWFNSFSFTSHVVEDTIQDEDAFLKRWQATAIHTGVLRGRKATYKKLQLEGSTLFKINEVGLISEFYTHSNVPQILAQEFSCPISFVNEVLPSAPPKSSADFLNDVSQSINIPLTNRELTILSMWLCGISIKETARKLGGISLRTIESYRDNIKCKLNVHNKAQLIDLIREKGLLEFLINFGGQRVNSVRFAVN